MTPTELEHYLHHEIPLTRAMQLSVLHADETTVLLQAPLTPNINPHGTVFGGSASAVAILAAWSLLHLRLMGAERPADIVIQRNTMEYLRPIAGPFTARAAFDATRVDWPQFLRILARKGRARIEIATTLERDGELLGRFSGTFVAFADAHP